jgi:DNA-binding CsgD family transcriptional regulator
MVGREDEKNHVLTSMNRGPGGSVVLAGRAGVGKTRLAAAVLDDLGHEGYVIERLVGTRAASRIPLGAIGALVARRDPGEGAGAGLLQTMAGVHRALHEQADGRPMVIAVDDAHCLDDASAAVIHQLVVAGIASVLITVRTGEPAPDAVTAVWKDGLAEIIELQPMADRDLRDLLEAVLDGPVDEHTALELVRSCDGNCLFLRELVRTAIDDGSLELDRGLWRLRRPVAPGPRLINLVEARLLDLPPETRDVLELTAVGEPMPLVLLEGLVSAKALADAARRELIDVEVDGRRSVARLGHPLYGDVVRARLPWLGLRARCRTLADALDATGFRRRDDVLRYVTWRLDAALGVDGDRLMAATERAQEGGDMTAVERFVSAAVEAGTVPADKQVSAHVALAEALNHRHRFKDSLALLGSVTPTNEMETVALGAWTSYTLFLSGRGDDGEAHVASVLADVELPMSRVHLKMTRVRIVAARGRPVEALHLLDEVLGTAEAAEMAAWVYSIQAPALAFAGRFAEAAEMAEGGINSHWGRMTPSRFGVEWAHATLEMVAIGRGDFNEAAALARQRVETGLNLGHASWRRQGAAALGWALFMKGAVTQALPYLIEAIDDARWLDYNGTRSFAWSGLAGSYVLAGDLDRAAETLTRAAKDPRPVRWFEPLMAIAPALLAHRRGLPSEARSILSGTLDETRRDVNMQTGLYVAMTASRVGAPDLALPYLEAVIEAGWADGPLPDLLLRQARALIDRDPAGLERVADGLEAGGMILPAIEMLVAAADIEAGGGRSRPALAARARAQRLTEQCPGVDFGFLDRPTTPARLTSRELEVASLAAVGLSSAEIAERLHLSVRTVDTHLGRVYLKLGVAGRAELRDVPELQSGSRPDLAG